MIREQIKLIDEDYIINLTNKGMYKRASKGMEKEGVSMEDQWVFKIGDETVSFGEKLEDFDCTCPATDYCKHVIMAYLHMMQNREDGEDEEETSLSMEDFAAINALTCKDIRKYTTQKTINDVVVSFDRMRISHEIGSLLKIDLGKKKHVNFTYPFDLEEAFKRNDEKDAIYAIKYIQNLAGQDNLKVEFKIPESQALEEVASYFENLIGIGLYSIKKSEIDRIEFLSIRIKLAKYNFLFKKMQNLKRTVKKYLTNDIDNRLEDINRQIGDILLNIYILLGNAQDEEKYRLFRRTEYKSEISELAGYGLGHEVVNLKDGSKLINMLVLDREDGEIYEITNLRRNSDDTRMYISSMSLFIQNVHSAHSLGGKGFKLKNVTMKEGNRMSNSSDLKLSFDNEDEIDLKDYELSMSQAIDRFIDEDQRVFILSDEIDAFYDFGFREEIQRFEISVREVCAYFKYEGKEDDKTIEYLKSLKQIDHMLVKLNRKDFHIEAKIIAVWADGKKMILREN